MARAVKSTSRLRRIERTSSRRARSGASGAPRGGSVRAHLKSLEGLFLDCDGVLTPGDLIYDENGTRLLRFHAKDGLALALLCRTDVPVTILSGRATDIAEHRFRELGVARFIGKCHDKGKALAEVCEELGIRREACAFVGDDLPDLAAFERCGLRIAVADAAAEVRAAADWVTKAAGGRGAVREVCEAILKARGEWAAVVDRMRGRR